MHTDKKFSQSIAGLAFVTGLLLLIPLIAMQFTGEVVWTVSDFVIMGVLIFGTGLAYILLTRKSGKTAYRAGIGIALAAAFLLIWVSGAVGIIGNEGNPANLMYSLVFAVGIIGAFIARFKSRGMALTLFATAFTQAMIPVIALIIWPPEVISWGEAGVFGAFVFNAFFVTLFIISALLFRYDDRASEAQVKNTVEPDTESTNW